MGKDYNIDELIAKFAAGTISESELEALIRWYNSFDDTQATVQSEGDDDAERLKMRMHQRLMRQIEEQPAVRKTPITTLRRLLPYAAAVLLVLLGVWYFHSFDTSLPEGSDTYVSVDDRAPGRSRATLTLADGTTVALDETQGGIVVGDDDISYRDGGMVWQQRQDTRKAQSATLSTPRGGTYEVVLPDGTQVWLNAASTLKYPSFFSGEERVVELEGEAYFSVKKYAGKTGNIPFKVLSRGQTIEVLGTEFNIEAFPEDVHIKTTLVNGKVKVIASNETAVLHPDQQSTFGASGIHVKSVDIRPYIAWKDGQFHFQRTSFEEVMKQVGRWYDVEVVYPKGIPQETFSGKVKRNVSLKGVLSILQMSTIDVKLENNKLIVNGK